MLTHIRPALATLALMTILTGLLYPLAVTGVAQAVMRAPADGSLVRDGSGKPIGSLLIGQAFARPEYLHGRPSAAGNGYDPTSSSGSNFGPLDPKLADRVKGDASKLAAATPGAAIPADAVTASASGLDPDISPAFADLQLARIAQARAAPLAEVKRLVDGLTVGRTLIVLGEPRVNVLAVNGALDAHFPLTRR